MDAPSPAPRAARDGPRDTDRASPPAASRRSSRRAASDGGSRLTTSEVDRFDRPDAPGSGASAVRRRVRTLVRDLPPPVPPALAGYRASRLRAAADRLP